MSAILEFIKISGSVAGLCTAGFLIWDRFIRHRPTVAPVVVHPDTAVGPKTIGFVIRNDSAWHCYINKASSNNTEILLSKFKDGSDIYNEELESASIVIAPQSVGHMFLFDYRDNKEDDYPLVVTIEWESSRHWGGVFRKLDWPLRIKVPMRRLASLTVQGETERK